MSLLDGLRYRLRAWFAPRRHARDAERELQFHLGLETAQQRSDGAPATDASFAARRRLGNPTAIAEEMRRAAGIGWLDLVRQDLTFAVRGIRGAPGLALLATATLALGVGAATAVFSVVDGVLLTPLPIPQADRVVAIELARAKTPVSASSRWYTSLPQYLRWQRLRSFSVVAAVGEPARVRRGRHVASEMAFADEDESRVIVTPASSRFFTLARVTTVLGRPFTAGDDEAGAQPAALLSYDYWRRAYGGDPRVLGRTVRLQGDDYDIVGVLAPGFSFPGDTQVWTTFGYVFGADMTSERTFMVHVLGRVRDGVSVQAARGEVASMFARDASEHPALRDLTVNVTGVRDTIVARVATPLCVMLGFVATLLLISAANVINMLLARGMARQHDVAVRLALGAGRGRIVRQFATEALLLALLGALAGIGAAALIVRFIVAQQALDLPRRGSIGLHPAVLIVCIGTALAVGIICGLIPALSVSRDAIDSTLRRDGGRLTANRRRRRLRNTLVVGEMAVAIVLLSGAGLLLKSFRGLMELRPGLTGDGVLGGIVRLELPEGDTVGRVELARALGERSRAIPGIVSASVATSFPFGGETTFSGLKVLGVAPDSAVQPVTRLTGMDNAYFRTLGMHIVRGRAFTRAEMARGGAAIINDATARMYFGGRDPIGMYLVLTGRRPLEVVGVVESVRDAGLAVDPDAQTYVPLSVADFSFDPSELDLSVIIRTARGDPATLMPWVEQAVRQVAPRATLMDFAPLPRFLAETAAGPHVYLVLLGGFALAATLLTALGLYGVIGYSVAQRTREIGIRVALGASPWRVRRRVVGEGMALVLRGVVVGTVVAIIATRILRSILYGVSPGDPAVSAGAAAVLVAVAAGACWIPARRAASADPLEAIRAE